MYFMFGCTWVTFLTSVGESYLLYNTVLRYLVFMESNVLLDKKWNE